ncbi:MAG: hypothetical protein R2701_00685 [Acidimicrobiales bacterium]
MVSEEQIRDAMAAAPEPPRDEELDAKMRRIQESIVDEFMQDHGDQPLSEEDGQALSKAIDQAFLDAGIDTVLGDPKAEVAVEPYTKDDYARSEQVFDSLVASESARLGCD